MLMVCSFVSSRPTPDLVITYLSMRGLEQIRITSIRGLDRLLTKVNELELLVTDRQHVESCPSHVGTIGSTIRCLYLSAMDSDLDLTPPLSEVSTTMKVLPNLKELTIAFMNARLLFGSLTSMCKLSALTHLRLLSC
jgi:hypothetical protein